jgi:hypothetical protein
MVEAGKTMLEQAAPNSDCSITIDVGYGTVQGSAMAGGAIGQTIINATLDFPATWDQLLAAMMAHGNHTKSQPYNQMISHLPGFGSGGPAGNPFSPTFYVCSAAARLLKLAPQYNSVVKPSNFTSSGIDAWCGFATSGASIATVLHEFTEALGRTVQFWPMTGSRFSSSGVWDQTSNTAGTYFSLDGGVTNIAPYGNGVSGTDYGDWLTTYNNEPFDAQDGGSLVQHLTPLCLQVFNAMGFC